jgi:hypothetical protein
MTNYKETASLAPEATSTSKQVKLSDYNFSKKTEEPEGALVYFEKSHVMNACVEMVNGDQSTRFVPRGEKMKI